MKNSTTYYNYRATIALTVLIIAGAAQYIYAAQMGLKSGSELYFLISSDLSEESGPLKYLKDVVLLIFGAIWPFSISKGLAKNLRLYLMWITSIVLVGFVAFILGNTPILFIVAGLRWVILMHACAGLYMLFRQNGLSYKEERIILNVVNAILVINLYFIVVQSNWLIGIFSLSGARFTGMFSNAGTAGYFALAMSIISFGLHRSPLLFVLFVNVLALLGALGSGTRYAIIGTLLIASYIAFGKLLQSIPKQGKVVFIFLIVVLAIPIMVGLTNVANTAAARGDMLDALSEGGRLYNLNELLRIIAQGGGDEILFGQGLGVGTNTGFGFSFNSGATSWNILMDNSFATTFIQIGLVGSLIFWTAIAYFVRFNTCWRNCIILVIFVIGLFVQNIPEQFFLMIGFAFVWATGRRNSNTSTLGANPG